MNEQECEHIQRDMNVLYNLHTESTYSESVLAAVAYCEVETPSPEQPHAFIDTFLVSKPKAFFKVFQNMEQFEAIWQYTKNKKRNDIQETTQNNWSISYCKALSMEISADALFACQNTMPGNLAVTMVPMQHSSLYQQASSFLTKALRRRVR